jgi:hypothetical protein
MSEHEYSHRGQHITLALPVGLACSPGDVVAINHRNFPRWIMAARVISVDAFHAVVEPGAAVKHPGDWHVVAPAMASVDEFAAEEISDVPQFDLFAEV